jgi:hypothetical protein
MRFLALSFVLSAALASGATAQTLAAPDPLLVVATAIGADAIQGATAFDVRVSDVTGKVRGRDAKRTSAVARALQADTVAGNKVFICATRSPRSCSLGRYARLISMAEPVISLDGKTAVVSVTTYSSTNMARVPVHVQDVEYTLVREGQGWRIVKQFTTRVT